MAHLTLIPGQLENTKMLDFFITFMKRLSADIAKCRGEIAGLNATAIRDFFANPFEVIHKPKQTANQATLYQPQFYDANSRKYNIFDPKFLERQLPDVQTDIKAFIKSSAEMANETTLMKQILFLDNEANVPVKTKIADLTFPKDALKILQLTLEFRLYNAIAEGKVHSMRESRKFLIEEYSKMHTESFPIENIEFANAHLSQMCDKFEHQFVQAPASLHKR